MQLGGQQLDVVTVVNAARDAMRPCGAVGVGHDEQRDQLRCVAGLRQRSLIAIEIELEQAEIGELAIESVGNRGRVDLLARLAPRRTDVDHESAVRRFDALHGLTHERGDIRRPGRRFDDLQTAVHRVGARYEKRRDQRLHVTIVPRRSRRRPLRDEMGYTGSMRPLLRIAIVALVSCNGGDGLKHIDSAVGTGDGPTDSAIDAAPLPVTVTITGNSGTAVVGATVYFQNADSSLVAEATTDASGSASQLMAAGGYVTALIPQVEDGFAASGFQQVQIETFAGVQPGDHLLISNSSSESEQAGSFTAAGNGMDITPGQVSRAVSELEGHLRTRLLNRTT